MKIIPAIDVINGRCVRLFKGDYNFQKDYLLSPFEVAQKIEEAGFSDLHLVDLEGAKEGRVINWPVIEQITQNTKLAVEVGGGVRVKDEVARLLALGAKRIMLGSLAIQNPDILRDLLAAFGSEKIMVDIGYKDGEVYYHGWQEKTGKEFEQVLKELLVMGVSRILLTDVDKDGALEGPNFALYKRVCRNFPKLLVTASGGISSKSDLRRLKNSGVSSVVVGKAFHEGWLSLSDLQNYEY
ncbi:MAG: 1-(5-phosphoribosyl)-5-[(5-phosphoribosylamino)methylideneamino]imidazole-4-carboxamide isomerase [Candidatus Gribaldobacteria bacterium]|nr:1-(5-phosphoribosyl)-5-[(5-phosphoribosylamino)methylideneamino]imidazole-4-carboxamide isomerase [Candidatus Gribaldobacteria bacterium]